LPWGPLSPKSSSTVDKIISHFLDHFLDSMEPEEQFKLDPARVAQHQALREKTGAHGADTSNNLNRVVLFLFDISGSMDEKSGPVTESWVGALRTQGVLDPTGSREEIEFQADPNRSKLSSMRELGSELLDIVTGKENKIGAAGVMVFNHDMNVLVPIKPLTGKGNAQHVGAMSNAITELKASGGTKLYDAIVAGRKVLADACRALKMQEGQLVVFTDCEDNMSSEAGKAECAKLQALFETRGKSGAKTSIALFGLKGLQKGDLAEDA